MKIEKISIHNFQSHKKTDIQFHKGVNVIVGESDVGKSAILRAINWVLTNRPTGNSFVSNWSDDGCQVHIEFDDGYIKRIKNKSMNGYIVSGLDWGEECYRNFGHGVPDEIAEFLNMNEINFQSQFDPPFMLSWTPGERGLFLNEVVDLSITDETIKNIISTIRLEKDHIKIQEDAIKDTEQKLEKYKDLDRINEELTKLEAMEEKADSMEEDMDSLYRIIYEVGDLNKTISKYKKLPAAKKNLKECFTTQNKMEKLKKDINSLGNLIRGIQRTNNIAVRLKDTPKIKRKVATLYRSMGTATKARKNALKLAGLIDEIKRRDALIEETKAKLKYGREVYEETFPSVCPLCEQEVKE